MLSSHVVYSPVGVWKIIRSKYRYGHRVITNKRQENLGGYFFFFSGVVRKTFLRRSYLRRHLKEVQKRTLCYN